ncbi:MAG: hypothetical protein IJL76_01530 [Bacilli bacterium]|nr:hypothetical protein [Bacilli bacterium]
MGFSSKKIEVNIPSLDELVSDVANGLEEKIEDVKNEVESIDLSDVSTKAGIFGDKYYGHKDYETLEDLDLKRKKNLDDIDKFVNLEKLDLQNCDLKDSSDLKSIPDTIESIKFTNCEIDDYSYLNNKRNLNKIVIYCADTGINLSQFQNRNLDTLVIDGCRGSITGDLSNMPGLETINISNTNITDLDFMRNNHNVKEVYLDSNLLTDISSLYDSDIEKLSIENNSIQELDISRFPKLKELNVSDNYALYTSELLAACKARGIEVDIDHDDVKMMNEVRDIIDDLHLEGKSQLEKEAIIYDYLMNHMEYNRKLEVESNMEPLKCALDGEGVCISYAVFFKALCNAAGINSYLDLGYAKQGVVIPGGLHAWNLIEIEGQYYLCDPTWSDKMRDSTLTFYGVKKLWSHFFSDSDLPPEDQFYNVYGKDAKKFMKQHRETANDVKKDEIYKDEEALNIVSVDTSDTIGQKLAVDTAVVATEPFSSGIKKISNELVEKLQISYRD